MKVIGYIRVSTDEQVKGASLDIQRNEITKWCAANGHELLEVYSDSVSGGASLEKRTVLMDAIQAVKANKAGALVLYKRDRLARDATNAGLIQRSLEKMKATVWTVLDGVNAVDPDDPMAMLINGVLDLVAQFERGQIRARTKAAMRYKKAAGEKYTRVTPYGVECVGDRFEQVANEAAVIADIVGMKRDGMSYREICQRLNEQGIPTKTGKQWQSATVYYLLKRSPIAKAA